MHKFLFIFSFFFSTYFSFSQILPESRRSDWNHAGLRDTSTAGFEVISLHNSALDGDGITPNDAVLSSIISGITAPGAILKFPEGNFLFNKTINIPSNIIIRGEGAVSTTITLDLKGSGHGIAVSGKSVPSDTSSLTEKASKDSLFIKVINSSLFKAGDWIQLVQNDSALVTSSWARGTVGQIVRITSVAGDRVIIGSPLRMEMLLSKKPFIRKIIPAQNVGIECLKIVRKDNTAPEQASNIRFSRAVNCWVSSVESENCTFSHVEAEYSSNLHFWGSYFHHAFEYGEGGRAYGIILHFTTNECLTENNIFKRLRHSMLLQAGANGNVFTYNYSTDPFWISGTIPTNAAGELVLHGNYPFSNLFEQNMCENIIIDNSHGANGPCNTFFRNRASGFGIFFSDTTSPRQNIIGNEIPNTGFPYNLVNYTISGKDHFLYGNNNKGVIHPAGTNALSEKSLVYSQRPDFVPQSDYGSIGTPAQMGSGTIPAYGRFNAGFLFVNVCGNYSTSIKDQYNPDENIRSFPNPFDDFISFSGVEKINQIRIINSIGELIYSANSFCDNKIPTSGWPAGIYFVQLIHSGNKIFESKMIRVGEGK